MLYLSPELSVRVSEMRQNSLWISRATCTAVGSNSCVGSFKPDFFFFLLKFFFCTFSVDSHRLWLLRGLWQHRHAWRERPTCNTPGRPGNGRHGRHVDVQMSGGWQGWGGGELSVAARTWFHHVPSSGASSADSFNRTAASLFYAVLFKITFNLKNLKLLYKREHTTMTIEVHVLRWTQTHSAMEDFCCLLSDKSS